MTHWFAEGDTPDGPRTILISGTDVSDCESAHGNAPILRVGHGAPDVLPAPVEPRDAGRVADFSQDKPVDRISGWVRLWLLGLLAQRPGWDGVVCATYGALTHWIELSADEAVSCRSAITLHLCRAMNGADRANEDAVSATISHPERLSTDLRSAQLIKDGPAVTGHLVGAELAAMRPYWLGREVVLVSDQPGLYSTAIQAQGVPVMSYSPEELLRTGLTAIARAHGLGD